MKIRYTADVANVAAGDIVDRPRSTAEFLIRQGLAEAVERWENEGGAPEQTPEAPQTAVEAPESPVEAPKPARKVTTPRKAPTARRGATRAK